MLGVADAIQAFQGQHRPGEESMHSWMQGRGSAAARTTKYDCRRTMARKKRKLATPELSMTMYMMNAQLDICSTIKIRLLVGVCS